MSNKNKLWLSLERMGDREKETADFSSYAAVLFYFLEFLRFNKIRKNNKTLVFSSPSFERGTIILLVLCAEAKQVGSSSSSSLLTAFIEVLLCACPKVRPQRHP